ncbi:MAG: cyclase family protein [Gemmatimonadales bacterium]
MPQPNLELDELRIIDVSHTIEDGMITYHGLPAPRICDFMSREASRAKYAAGTEFVIGEITMVGNTGTYVDAPFHRYADGADFTELPLASLVNLETVIVRHDSGPERAIDSITLGERDVRGRAILFQTGWDRHWRSELYHVGHPHLTGKVAEQLVEMGATLVGIDSFNIDCTDDGERPVHSTLLGAGIPIVEHLCGLSEAPETGGRFFAAPPKVRAFGSFPVRAFILAR